MEDKCDLVHFRPLAFASCGSVGEGVLNLLNGVKKRASKEGDKLKKEMVAVSVCSNNRSWELESAE